MIRWLRGPGWKLIVSLVLIGVLVRRYGGDPEFRATLTRLHPASFLQAELILAVGLVLSALRWKILLGAAGVSISLWRALRLYLGAFFFNLFLPTSVGGDVVKLFGVGGGTRLPVVAGSILIERILGFGSLLGIGLTATFLVSSLGAARGALLLASAAFVAGLVVVLFVPLPEVAKEGIAGRILRGIRATALEVRAYGFHAKALVLGFLLSVSWQGGLVVVNWRLSEGLGGVCSFGAIAGIVPVAQAIAMIPVSFGGLGIREMGYEFFFGQSGFEPRDGFALGICFLGATVFVALIGGLVYALTAGREKAPTGG